MSYQFSLHPDTEKDFSEAYEWYQDKTEGLGERFLKAVRKKLKKLQQTLKYTEAKEEKVIVRPHLVSFLMSLFLRFMKKKD